MIDIVRDMNLGDAELVKMAVSGDSKAFDSLVKRFQRAVHAVAFAVVGDREAALDVLQESFIAAYHQMHTLNDPGKFGPWICGIARNQAKRVRRVRYRHTNRELPMSEMETASEKSQTNTLAESIRDALASLTETQADVVTLFYMEGYSVAECSLLLEVPQGTIKRRLHDARQRLKREMTDMVKNTFQNSRCPRIIELLSIKPHRFTARGRRPCGSRTGGCYYGKMVCPGNRMMARSGSGFLRVRTAKYGLSQGSLSCLKERM